ncbi:MAG: ribonuclease P protein component [Ekhidna sp.]|nr:ribonuclease P protein component [Ekhidna sp.]
MGPLRYTFPKAEKLTGKKKIEELFKRGSSFYLNSFQVRYLLIEGEECTQVLISVPKRNFKKAVERNLLKRKIREAYRINKHSLHLKAGVPKYRIAFIYLSKDILSFKEIQAQLIGCLKRLETIE